MVHWKTLVTNWEKITNGTIGKDVLIIGKLAM